MAEITNGIVDAGYGIHQLPCPERLAWGGVINRHSLRLYHSKGAISGADLRHDRPVKCARLPPLVPGFHEEHAPELKLDVARGNGTEVDQPLQ
ncbi:hypothetical protein [Mycobacterium antarcticum]|uniref:hypothetical protein n=1 Tax=Mycolicibacterium sp. TUM20984 TaxID=3023368 RepID=UPI00238FB045|nr:hypothetical protein [Mycolicibacterium sp. TUM20984]GLP81529.1 hypothetical protein TUM20984_29490 [Mycolicibacterium sp. TUM20984]